MAAKLITNRDKLVDNISLVLHKKGDIRVQQWPIPQQIEPNEVLVKTHSCGLCGTDMHLWEHGGYSEFFATQPMVIGHETSATVVEVGESVTKVKPGDRVVIEPCIACLNCDICRRGKYNLCPTINQRARGTPPKDGCLRRYYTHPEPFVHKIPDNVSWEEGAMCEPFAVIVHACNRVRIGVGDNVLICGAGAMGMMGMLCAKAYGANKVAITDINSKRLETAKSLGADYTYLIDPKNFDPIKMAEKIKKDMDVPIDVTLECTGMGQSTSMGIYATKFGGKLAMVGLGNLTVNVPLVIASIREVDLFGVCRFLHTFPSAIHLIASGKVNLKPLATHMFKIENAIEAFEAMKNGSSNSVKLMIQFQ